MVIFYLNSFIDQCFYKVSKINCWENNISRKDMQMEDECFSLYKSIIVIELLLSFSILNFHAYNSLKTVLRMI